MVLKLNFVQIEIRNLVDLDQLKNEMLIKVLILIFFVLIKKNFDQYMNVNLYINKQEQQIENEKRQLYKYKTDMYTCICTCIIRKNVTIKPNIHGGDVKKHIYYCI
jgi:hypothetical protein